MHVCHHTLIRVNVVLFCPRPRLVPQYLGASYLIISLCYLITLLAFLLSSSPHSLISTALLHTHVLYPFINIFAFLIMSLFTYKCICLTISPSLSLSLCPSFPFSRLLSFSTSFSLSLSFPFSCFLSLSLSVPLLIIFSFFLSFSLSLSVFFTPFISFTLFLSFYFSSFVCPYLSLNLPYSLSVSLIPLSDSFSLSYSLSLSLSFRDYTQVVMNYLEGKKAGTEKDLKWAESFDVIIVGGNKPAFLEDERYS